MSQSLPVLMYHYISNYPSSISVSPHNFEKHCQGMAENGWKGITLQEAESFFLKGEKLPPKSVLITFDDGFLDNFVYAWPILKKYEHNGVIFTVTERILSEQIVRPTLFDVWDESISNKVLYELVDMPIKQTKLGLKKRQDAFLSWEECRIMEKSGVISIGAHSAHHLSVFANNTWEDLYIPSDQYRTFYKIDAPIVWGMPCFKEKSALHCKAFIPSKKLTELITYHVPQQKQQAYEYFQQPHNITSLKQKIQTLSSNSLGSFETWGQQQKRLILDFEQCKNTLEKELGHNVQSFCWPWGESSIIAQSIGRSFGFSYFYKTSMGANPSKKYTAINRFKVRNKGWNWLRWRLEIYSRIMPATVYAKIRI